MWIKILIDILVKVLPDILPYIINSKNPEKTLQEFHDHLKAFKK